MSRIAIFGSMLDGVPPTTTACVSTRLSCREWHPMSSSRPPHGRAVRSSPQQPGSDQRARNRSADTVRAAPGNAARHCVRISLFEAEAFDGDADATPWARYSEHAAKGKAARGQLPAGQVWKKKRHSKEVHVAGLLMSKAESANSAGSIAREPSRVANSHCNGALPIGGHTRDPVRQKGPNLAFLLLPQESVGWIAAKNS
jgi:hypothetical protein